MSCCGQKKKKNQQKDTPSTVYNQPPVQKQEKLHQEQPVQQLKTQEKTEPVLQTNQEKTPPMQQYNSETGEFNQEEIGEFHQSNVNSGQNSQDFQQYQQQDYAGGLDETIGYINIIDEDQRAPTDFNKNLPRVGCYQNSQFNKTNNKILDSVENEPRVLQTTAASFLRYQFPDFFIKKDKIFMSQIKDFNNKSGAVEEEEQQSSNQELQNNHVQVKQKTKEVIKIEDQDSQEGILIKEVVNEIIQVANGQSEEEAIKQNIDLSPRTLQGYEQLNKKSSENGNFDFIAKASKDCIEDETITNNNTAQKPQPLSARRSMMTQSFTIETMRYEQGSQAINTFLNSLPEPVEVSKDIIFQYNIPDIEYSNKNKKEIREMVEQFKYYPSVKTDKRQEYAYKSGGKKCVNSTIVDILRSTAKEIISIVGRKVLKGDFNLTQISFPIKVMIPISGLEKAMNSTCLFPLYLNKAASITDPIERFKLVISASIGHFFINLSFLKPLNPILGETAEAHYPDGTKIYAEQISHHPPVSYFSVYGPKDSYKFWGNYHFESNAGLNNLLLKNSGKRCVQFKDGQKIEYNFGKERYTGSFWGTMRTECEGKMNFIDTKNNIEAKIEFDKVSGKPSDFIKGWIKKDDKKVSEIYGSYMEFLEFDGVRYWDLNKTIAFKPILTCSGLGSDQAFRADKELLQRGHIESAQQKKEELEQLQRADRKLREQFTKDNKKDTKKNNKKK